MFSHPNDRNEKFVYYARVLVGESTEGQPGLIDAPTNPQTNEHYDSVSGYQQSTFVIFSDTQAYPEYLIKFK